MNRLCRTYAIHYILLLSITLTFSALSIAQAPVPAPEFEVASVKAAPHADPATGSWSRPGGDTFTATHVSLALLVHLAYGVDVGQIENAPSWFNADLFDINAKVGPGVDLTRDELKPRLQKLLAERFHLRAHPDTKIARGYALEVGKHGPHLTPTKGDHFPGFRANVSPGQMRGFNWTMAQLAAYLTTPAGFPVVDDTHLEGSYDIAFSYDSTNGRSESELLPLNDALQRATGLVLKPTKTPVSVLVIDSVDRTPTEN